MTQEYEQIPKLQLVPGGTEKSATFVMSDEDHTLGNALRYMLMRNKDTIFCGYSMPHPSEAVVNIRLQTQTQPVIEVFRDGLAQLVDVAEHIGNVFDTALETGPVDDPSVIPSSSNTMNNGSNSGTTSSSSKSHTSSSSKSKKVGKNNNVNDSIDMEEEDEDTAKKQKKKTKG